MSFWFLLASVIYFFLNLKGNIDNSAIMMFSKGQDKKKKTKEGKLVISLNTFFWILGCLDVTQIWCFSAFNSLTFCVRWEIPRRVGLRGFWPLSWAPPGAVPGAGSAAEEGLCPRAASCLCTPTAARSLWVNKQDKLSVRRDLYLAPPLASLENWSPTWADRHPLLLKRQKQSSYLITLGIFVYPDINSPLDFKSTQGFKNPCRDTRYRSASLILRSSWGAIICSIYSSLPVVLVFFFFFNFARCFRITSIIIFINAFFFKHLLHCSFQLCLVTLNSTAF